MKMPKGANEYGSEEGQDQIILDSGRLLFHAKSDYIMSYSDKGFSFSTNGGFHINGGVGKDSITHINTEKIYLGLNAGSKGQPVLMGDDTSKWLERLVSQLEGLSNILGKQIAPLMWPVGTGPVQVPLMLEAYNEALNTLKIDLEKIKSKSVFLVKDGTGKSEGFIGPINQ